MVGHRAARRSAARICSLARLRAHALWLCGEAVRQGTDRHARDHRAGRRGAGRVYKSGAVHADSEAIAIAPARAEALAREADEATKMALEAKSAAALAAREAAPLMASLRRLKGFKTDADAALALAEKVLAAAETDQAKAQADELKQKAAAKVVELQTQLDTAEVNAKSKLDAAAAAQDAAKAAEDKRTDAAKAAREAKLALQPVSVFISRTTQKLYVRRGVESILEVPLTIRNPDKPIGTHVFTAVARAGEGLR